MTRPWPRTFGIGAALAVAYILSANLGFSVAFVAEQVTTVWAPTGIAQAALLLWGRRLWPAVWLGAFIVNAATDAPLWTAAPIATGNTLEAVTTAWLLRRATGFDPALRRTRDGLAFIAVAALAAPVISATIGVATICAAGAQPWTNFTGLWFAWWLGDAIGALIVGPVLLTLARAAKGRSPGSWVETAALVIGTIGVTHAAFRQQVITVGPHPLEYVIFPFLIAAAVRQGQPATSLVVFSAAAVAIGNTIAGSGPFAAGEPHDSLMLLQLFMGVAAGTGLLLAGAIAERETSQRRQAAAHAASRVLAGAPTLPDAATDILRGVCQNLDWSHGAMWIVDDARRLNCFTTWPPSGPFAEASRSRTFAAGEGLPGRVWQSGQPTWIEDIAEDRNFPRSAVAREAGLHSAFAFPIRAGRDIQGVLEFFNRSIVAPDDDLLATMTSVGHQLGQFVVRKRAEAAVIAGQREREGLLQRELAARRDAEEANRAKDEFLATLSHELRTPLNAIVGWTHMLRDGSVSPQQRQHALEVIARNAQVQAQLVADILDVSSIITGGLKLNAGRLDPGAVIQSSIEALGPMARAKGVAVETRLPAESRPIDGDAQRLQQVVGNLVGNAIKFTPAGGRIEVDLLETSDDSVRIVVRDSGDGIDPDFLPHVFDRFRQADASVRRQHGGLGLGLAIVRHIVELHGGSVQAESAGRGRGAVFAVDLPRGRSERA